MEFKNEIGKLQRLVSASYAGISRRQAVLETLIIKPNDHIIAVSYTHLTLPTTPYV